MSDLAVRQHEVPLPDLPEPLSPLRIAHMSDFHFGRWKRLHDRLQAKLVDLDCDLLVLTGDYCLFPWYWPQAVRLLARFLDPVQPRFGCYAILGNHDAPVFADRFPSGRLRFLFNESVKVGLNGATINLAGIDDGWRSVADLPKTLKHCHDAGPTVLLSHVPSTIHFLPDGLVDLVLSGHTHGGQWRLPVLGSVLLNDRIARGQTRGLHRVGQRWLHVTAGVGTSGPFHIRLNCPSEVAVLTLIRGTHG